MTMQLSSIDHMPSHVPIWHLMMDDLCNPPAQRVARVLGLSLRSIQRYNATGYAPRHVCLALFWLTRWGRSHVNAQAENAASLTASYFRSLKERVTELEAHVEHLIQIGDFGSANQPGDRPPITRRRPLALPR